MKAFIKTDPAVDSARRIYAVSSARYLGMVGVSFFLGMTALVVSFGAASAFETRGTDLFREIVAACVAAGLYLAFCQFWVAPRKPSGLLAKLSILVASVVPLLAGMVPFTPRSEGIPWFASGCIGSLIGAIVAQKVTATPYGKTSPDDSSNRGRICRRNLLIGFILAVAIALVIPIGVIPSVMADTAHGSYSRTNGKFLGGTVVFDLLAVAILASALWRPRQRDPSSKGTLGTTAFLTLLLGLAYCGMGALFSGYGPALRIASVLLFLCSALGFIITALMSINSVIVDRARLSH